MLRPYTNRGPTSCPISGSHHVPSSGSQIPPRVQPIEILKPPISNVLSIVHVGDHDVVDPVVGLFLRGLHRGADADADQDYAGLAEDDTLVVDLLVLFYVAAIAPPLLD